MSMNKVKAIIAARVSANTLRFITAGFLVIASALLALNVNSGDPVPASVEPVAYVAPERPDPLTPHDRVLYQSIYMMQEDGEFAEADALIAQLDSQLLLGHVLAQRYLFTDYKSDATELKTWVENFPDHPQSTKIRALAARKGATIAALPKQEPALKGAGYIDHLGAKSMPAGWYHGLTLWREKAYGRAALQFEKVATNESLNDWNRSAAYFWAHRAYERTGDDAADDMLDLAAEYPTTFYGLLANAKLNDSRSWMASAPYVPSALRRHPSVLRAQALASIGREDDAEEEMRRIFSSLPRHERKAMVTLASEFNLPNLQVRLSKMKELTDEEALFASYPMPQAVADAQTAIDSALIFAISRQESGFRPDVASHAGAVGMMQVLPSTAKYIVRSIDTDIATIDLSRLQLKDADTNVRLGAAYIEMLMKEPSVNGSMIHTIASYNAGPGAVASWAKAARNIDDPLLYIESIPYGETRNYVVQVLAHYWVYQHLMGEQAVTLQAIADGHWPQYNMG
jgi:soluble lytic murein transglycosylase-like protein